MRSDLSENWEDIASLPVYVMYRVVHLWAEISYMVYIQWDIIVPFNMSYFFNSWLIILLIIVIPHWAYTALN